MTSREQILKNTSALFLERGCRSLTMDEVASVNGMSKRTLYELFHDKAELLQECILLLHRDNMTQAEKELSEADNVLEWFLRTLGSKESLRTSFYYDFFTEVKKYYPEVFVNVVRDVNRWHCGMLERIIGRGQHDGLFATGLVDAHEFSLRLFELSVAVTDRAVRNYLDMKRDCGNNSLMLLLIRGIATEKGRKYIDEYLKNNQSLLQ